MIIRRFIQNLVLLWTTVIITETASRDVVFQYIQWHVLLIIQYHAPVCSKSL